MPVLDITTKIGCVNNCGYCPQEKITSSYRKKSNVTLMSFELFKQCLDKVPVDVGIYFGGMCEAFLNPECSRMILYAAQKGHMVSVFSALVGMSLSDIDLLATLKYQYFVVHLAAGDGSDNIKVDQHYLEILKKLLASPIQVSYHYRGHSLHPQIAALSLSKVIKKKSHCRAGNIRIKDKALPLRRLGTIDCQCGFQYSILLPNADVLLCCMDYGMDSILGNLLHVEYVDLFKSKEFVRIKNGLTDESIDILCRYCDRAKDINLRARIHNFLPYSYKYLNIYHEGLQHLINIRSVYDFRMFLKLCILKLRRYLKFG